MTTDNNDTPSQNAGLPAPAQSPRALMQTSTDAVIAQLPDSIRSAIEAATHATDFKADDTLVPFLQIVQSMSPYVKRADPGYIEGAREGDLIDTLTLKLRQEACFIPCKFETHYTEWKPRVGQARGGLVKQWFGDDRMYRVSQGDYGTRVTPEGNEITVSAVYYGLLITDYESGSSIPVVVSLNSTQFSKRRHWNGLIMALEFKNKEGERYNPAMFSRSYIMTTVPESNERGSWFGWKIEPGPLTFVLPGGMALFARAKKLREDIDAGLVRPAPPPVSSNEGDTAPAAAAAAASTAGATPNPRVLDDDIPF